MSEPSVTPAAVEPQPLRHTTCRICHAPLTPILTLGPQALSDFPASAGSRPYPPVSLDLVRCTDPTCGLVQLAYTTPREWLYRQYWYRSGVNETMRTELADVVIRGLGHTPLSHHGPVVADIGANDGTLLSLYPEILLGMGYHHLPLTRIAWEPARNLYQACRPHAEVLYPDFFHVGGEEPWSLPVHLLTMIACFYDLDDPHQTVADAARILAPQGVWIIQQAYLPDMLRAVGYDNICHEHLEYYHLQPLEKLLLSHGLEVFHVEHRAINGGSFRAYVGRVGRHPIAPSVALLRAQEASLHLDAPATWDGFVGAVADRVGQLQEAVYRIVDAGGTVDVYGASTKGNTLLQTCQFDGRIIRQAWERSPEKVGRYVGVTGIPIVSEAEGRQDPPTALLVLPWGFRDSFLAREQEYLAGGGRLIFPLPVVEVVSVVGTR